jgi:hypothetical protein
VLPLTAGLRSALFVPSATIAPPPPPETIGNAFQLTPTELNVLLSIVEVSSAPEERSRWAVGYRQYFAIDGIGRLS